MKNLSKIDTEKLDDLPKKEKPRRDYDDRYYNRSDFPWKKVQSFIEHRVGSPWDNVFSEYVHLDWVPKQYKTIDWITKHVGVEINTFIQDGKVFYYTNYNRYCHHTNYNLPSNAYPIDDRGYRDNYYVHPKTKLLCKNSKAPKTSWKKKEAEEKAKTFRIIGDYHQLVKRNGIWFEVKGEPKKPNYFKENGLYFKMVFGEKVPYTPLKFESPISPNESILDHYNDSSIFFEDHRWRRSVKITLFRQLNSKDLKKYGLRNDVKKISKPCLVCGNLECINFNHQNK